MAKKKPVKVVDDPGSYIDGWNMMYNTQTIAIKSNLGAFPLYMQLLGYNWFEVKNKLAGHTVTELQNAMIFDKNVGLIVLSFYELYQLAGFQKLYDTFTAGKISPDLEKILNRQPWQNDEVFNVILNDGDFSEVVLQAVKDGKLDFQPFNDTGDNAPDWFLKYRLSPVPIPGYFGRVSNLGKLTGSDVTQINARKTQVKKELKEIIANALKTGTKSEILLLLADSVKARYNELKDVQDVNSYYSIFPFKNPRSAGFVVDVSAEVIFDLRPHYKELQESLTPGAEPLKEFYYAVRRYISDALKKEKPATERPDEELFAKTDPFLLMKNSPESNAIASVSTGLTSMVVQQELPLQDDNGEPLYNYSTSVPVKTGDVIIKVSETPKGRALSPGTGKLQILFDTLFTLSGLMSFPVPVDGYMEYCKEDKTKPTSPESRRKFKRKMFANLRTMRNMTYDAKVEGATEPGEIGILRNWLPLPGNKVLIEMEPRYCQTLNSQRAGNIQISKAVFRLPETNPHLVSMIRKLSYNRTLYSNQNCNGVRSHRISFKTLYENDLSFPRLKVLIKTRQYRRNVIEPMINAIKILNDLKFIKSKYIDPDGIERTAEELATVSFTDFMDRQKWLLDYELLDPDTGEPFKENPEQRKAAIERAETREEEKLKKAYKKGFKAGKKKAEKKQ